MHGGPQASIFYLLAFGGREPKPKMHLKKIILMQMQFPVFVGWEHASKRNITRPLCPGFPMLRYLFAHSSMIVVLVLFV
jgi:hypothetical protein